MIDIQHTKRIMGIGIRTTATHLQLPLKVLDAIGLLEAVRVVRDLEQRRAELLSARGQSFPEIDLKYKIKKPKKNIKWIRCVDGKTPAKKIRGDQTN